MTLQIQIVSDDPDAADEHAMIHWLNHQLSPMDKDEAFADIVTFIGGLLQKRAARMQGRSEARSKRYGKVTFTNGPG